MGRIRRFHADHADGRSRRIFLFAAPSRERLLTEPEATAQPWRRELVLMPHCRPMRKHIQPEPEEFATDSPLEEAGFEPSVPLVRSSQTRRWRMGFEPSVRLVPSGGLDARS